MMTSLRALMAVLATKIVPMDARAIPIPTVRATKVSRRREARPQRPHIGQRLRPRWKRPLLLPRQSAKNSAGSLLASNKDVSILLVRVVAQLLVIRNWEQLATLERSSCSLLKST